MLVYQSNSIIGQRRILRTKSFDAAFAVFNSTSRFNLKDIQTCYLVYFDSEEEE